MSISDLAIRVRGLCKSYSIRHETKRNAESTLAETVLKRLRNPRARGGETKMFHALKDVDFDVKRGDVVGIIGRNGAGKSTLLKILSRITEPTTGRVEIEGRVGSLLEVGTGFHPELSGRENVYLNGAILGMRKAEVRAKFDEIVAFAEVERFLDTPVKRYSSGMYTRLAFAVAAHLEPDVLIVDEVLAVGDAQFQKKCLGRMSMVASEGRTVLFVSHDMGAVRSICRTALMLAAGRVQHIGAADRIVEEYLTTGAATNAAGADAGSCRLDRAGVHDVRDGQVGDPVYAVELGGDVALAVDYTLREPLEAGVSIRVTDARGFVLFDSHEFVGRAPPRSAGAYRSTFRFDRLPLAPGRYTVSVFVMVHHGPQHLVVDPCFDFEVVGALNLTGGGIRTFDIGGVLYLRPDVETVPWPTSAAL